jgi:hypothetical protein
MTCETFPSPSQLVVAVSRELPVKSLFDFRLPLDIVHFNSSVPLYSLARSPEFSEISPALPLSMARSKRILSPVQDYIRIHLDRHPYRGL